MNTGNVYLKSIRKEFQHYKILAEKAMNQPEEGQLFLSANEDSNSIAIIIKHLHGNMLSRWTDFLITDGEKPWRDRDGEFENALTDKKELLKQWEAGWACLFTALEQLSDELLEKAVYIRNEPLTVMEAINRQLAHYAYHVGQIVLLSKQLKKASWNSLSIPKKMSKEYTGVPIEKKQQD